MNIPNTITMTRLVMTVFVFVLLELHAAADAANATKTLPWVAFTLFLAASVTDFLDGYLARKWNMVSAFGRIADPFADKILIAGTLISLLHFHLATDVLPHWYVVVVIAREFLVTAIRGYVESTGKAFGADRLGKWKMVSQCWTVAAVLSMVAGSSWFEWAAVGGFWVSLALTVVSGMNYCIKARESILGGAS